MYQRTIQLTTGFMTALTVLAVMGHAAPPHHKRHDGARPAKAASPGSGVSAVLISQGHTLFLTNCSPCHGADAEGDDGPNLHHKNLPDAFIATAVTSGFKGEMPPFGSKLKTAQVKALVAYVHSVQK